MQSVSGGTSVLKVTATDEDSGLHGVIVYSILSGSIHNSCMELKGIIGNRG